MSTLGSFIWSIADQLRGPYRPNQYGNVILPLTILRRLDCILEPDRETVRRGLIEIEALYCAGPAAGGGIRTALRPRIAATSCFVPRAAVRPKVEIVEAGRA